MSFVYPAEVGRILTERWHTLQARLNPPAQPKRKGATAPPAISPPFPSEDNLVLLLDTVYHASFLVEEGRQLCIRLLYLPPESSDAESTQVMNFHGPPYEFTPPCPLTVPELLRLVPALDPFQSVLVICADTDLPNPTGAASLVIWGVLRVGMEWHRVVTGRESGALSPPNCLTITSQFSGRITATTSGMVLVRLEGGRILGMPLGYIGEGTIGEFLRPSAEQLYSDVVKKLGLKKYHRASDFDQHPRQQYFRVLSNIVNVAKEKGHGATFAIFPDTIEPQDHRLADRISLKYMINGVYIWKDLVEESIANHEFFKHLFPKKHIFLTQQEDAKPEKLKQLIRWENLKERAEEKIREFENFVATLSGVDGCVVLTSKLRVLGFGGEITAQSPSLTHVKVAHDPHARQTSDLKITTFGTRHRSAFRLCSSFESCLAFVVSQDGGVKAITRVGPDVVIWPDMNMGKYDL